MKNISISIVITLLCIPAFGQVNQVYAPVPPTSFPALNNNLDSKPAFTGGVGAPTSPCTAAKDLYVSTAGAFYVCTATNIWSLQSAGGGGITAITGDLSASGTGSVVGTLATVNSGPGNCGDATHVCAVTTNAKGLVTAQASTAITYPTGSTLLVSVTQSPYSAICGDTGNQAAAINAAITAVNAAGGGTVTAPGGCTLRVTAAVTMLSGVTLAATAGSFTIHQATSGTEAIDVGGTTSAGIAGVTFDGGIIANAGGTPTTKLTIRNNTVKNATLASTFGVGFYSSIACTNCVVQGNTFTNVYQGMLFGTMKHVQILNNTCDGLTGQDCFYATNTGASNADTNSSLDVLIQGNIGTNLWRMGIELQGWYSDAVRILGNRMGTWNGSAPGTERFGISLATQGTGGIVQGNTVYGIAATTEVGIELQGPAGSKAVDNVITNFKDGIQLGLACTVGCSITNNTITTATNGINALNSSVITSPVIDNNHIFEASALCIFLQDGGSTNAVVTNNTCSRTPTVSDTNFYAWGVGASASKRTFQGNTFILQTGSFPGGATYNCFILTANVPGTIYQNNDCINLNVSTTGTLGILANSASTELNGVFVIGNTFKNFAAVTNLTSTASTPWYANNKSLGFTPVSYLSVYTSNVGVGAATPASCTIGDIWFLTGATAGANVSGCTAPNTWTVQGGGSGTVAVVGSGTLTSTACVTGGGTQLVQTPSVNCTVDTSGNMTANTGTFPGGVATGTSPPSFTSGTGAVWALGEGTSPSAGPATSVDICYADATQHGILCSTNNRPYANIGARAVGFSIGTPGGTALSAGATTTAYVTMPYACTITGWALQIDAGTITVKFWKVAGGTAIPTSAASINTSGVAISTGTAIQSTTLSDFTTVAISKGDQLAMNVTTVATAAYVSGSLQCNQ